MEDMLRRGELKTVNEILLKYAACISLEAPERAAQLLLDFRSCRNVRQRRRQRFDGCDSPTRNQLAIERETGITNLNQRRIRAHEPGSRLQALLSGNATGGWRRSHSVKRSVPARPKVAPRIGAKERLPEFIEEALRAGHIADGMSEILSLMPKATLHYITNRFAHCGFREDCDY